MIFALITAQWRTLLAAAALIVLAFGLGQCRGARIERDRNAATMARAEAARLRINAAAHRLAEARRSADAARIATQDKERLDAIQSAPATRTGAATRALGCVRLRQAGRDRDADAAGC